LRIVAAVEPFPKNEAIGRREFFVDVNRALPLFTNQFFESFPIFFIYKPAAQIFNLRSFENCLSQRSTLPLPTELRSLRSMGRSISLPIFLMALKRPLATEPISGMKPMQVMIKLVHASL
jgi:hypothetical protein